MKFKTLQYDHPSILLLVKRSQKFVEKSNGTVFVALRSVRTTRGVP